jgi:hypothetical protein
MAPKISKQKRNWKKIKKFAKALGEKVRKRYDLGKKIKNMGGVTLY